MTDVLMHNYVNEANEIIKKAKSYKDYSKKLAKIIKELNAIPLKLNLATRYFLSGGYVDNGKSLYQTEINTTAANAESVTTNLNNLMKKTEKEIESFKNDYNDIKFKFELEKTAFLSCDDRTGSVPTFPEFII